MADFLLSSSALSLVSSISCFLIWLRISLIFVSPQWNFSSPHLKTDEHLSKSHVRAVWPRRRWQFLQMFPSIWFDLTRLILSEISFSFSRSFVINTCFSCIFFSVFNTYLWSGVFPSNKSLQSVSSSESFDSSPSNCSPNVSAVRFSAGILSSFLLQLDSIIYTWRRAHK